VNRPSESAKLSDLSVDIESSVTSTICIDLNLLNDDWVHLNESDVLKDFDVSVDALRSYSKTPVPAKIHCLGSDLLDPTWRDPDITPVIILSGSFSVISSSDVRISNG